MRNNYCTLESVAFSLCLLASWPGPSHAATLSVTPNSVSNLYSGNFTFQITGLTNGETVRLERYIDANTNGIQDGNEATVQSFLLTDGHVTSIGGVRNGNVPGDDDLTANGQITATISFANSPEFTRASGSQIFRLSSPTTNWPPVQQSITVTQTAYPHRVMGRVLDLGSPLPYATAALMILSGSDLQFVAGTVADASGNYSIMASNGTYLVVGFFPGRIGSLATTPVVKVSGADVTTNVPLTQCTYTISGFVTSSPTGLGVPAIQVFVTSTNNQYSAFFTYPHGGIVVYVVNGQWKLDQSDLTLLQNGMFRNQSKVKVTVAGTNVTGVSVPCFSETALIYGTVTDGSGNPLAGVNLDGFDSLNVYSSKAVSDTGGNYFLAVDAGTWNIIADSKRSGLPAGYTMQPAQAALADGQAVRVDLVAQPPTYLAGRATDSLGHAITNGTMLGIASTYSVAAAQLASDGSFAVQVLPGDWTLTLEAQTASSWNVVAFGIPFTVTSNGSISNINYVAPVSTRTISGRVYTAPNRGVSGIYVFASATLSGTNYNSNGPTDTNGYYSLPVLPGVWSVGPDSIGLGQQGYATAPSQNADTTSANQIVNFLVGTPTTNTMFFRHDLGVVGQFGTGLTPSVTYPVSIKNYRAIFLAFNETNPPSSDTVSFTGPPGSGLTNTPADPSLGAVQSGTDVYYFSPAVANPPIASGGGWSVVYRTNANNINVPDPQAASRTVVPLPTITLSNGVLSSLAWVYNDQSGNPIVGVPIYIETNRIDLLDQNGSVFDVEVFPLALAFTYPAASLYPWSSVGTLRLDYYDNLKNQYFVAFSKSAPTLTGPSYGPGQQFQFLFNGSTGVNFTVQYSTNLGATFWTTLLVTNSLTSPIRILDPNASSPDRFYRVLSGP